MFPNVGPMEIVVVLMIALVVFGPRKVPELGRSLGRGIRELKSSLSTDGEEEADEPAPQPISKATSSSS
jgi:sec-independent protein translocase protein TatA